MPGGAQFFDLQHAIGPDAPAPAAAIAGIAAPVVPAMAVPVVPAVPVPSALAIVPAGVVVPPAAGMQAAAQAGVVAPQVHVAAPAAQTHVIPVSFYEGTRSWSALVCKKPGAHVWTAFTVDVAPQPLTTYNDPARRTQLVAQLHAETDGQFPADQSVYRYVPAHEVGLNPSYVFVKVPHFVKGSVLASPEKLAAGWNFAWLPLGWIVDLQPGDALPWSDDPVYVPMAPGLLEVLQGGLQRMEAYGKDFFETYQQAIVGIGCPVCLDETVALVNFGDCGHKICKKCKRDVSNAGHAAAKCPICRGAIGAD